LGLKFSLKLCFAIDLLDHGAPFRDIRFHPASISVGARLSVDPEFKRALLNRRQNRAQCAVEVSIATGGMPVGAYNAFHDTTSKPATPLCATVGMLKRR
jgi:hypothetical protein